MERLTEGEGTEGSAVLPLMGGEFGHGALLGGGCGWSWRCLVHCWLVDRYVEFMRVDDVRGELGFEISNFRS